MQEEVTQKTIALSMKTGKLTAQALQAALKKYLVLFGFYRVSLLTLAIRNEFCLLLRSVTYC